MLVKISSCKNAFEGELVKGMLADNGIECYLQNETMSQLYGGIQAMEINVLVQEEDAEKAMELLNTRPEMESMEHDTPQQKRKSIKQIVFEALLFSVFITAFMLLGAWINHDFKPILQYTWQAVCYFVGYFLTAMLFRMTWKKKVE